MKGIYEYVRDKYEITDKKSVREVIAEGQKSGEITVRVNVENKFEPHYCVNSSSRKLLLPQLLQLPPCNRN